MAQSNQDQNSINSAISQSTSGNQSARHELVSRIFSHMGIKAKSHDVIHQYQGNSRPSVGIEVEHPHDKKHSLYTAAYHGLMSDEPGQMVFHPGEGDDHLHSIRLAGDPDAISQVFDQHGIRQRHMMPMKDAQGGPEFRVLVYDKGGRYIEPLTRLASAVNGKVYTQRGTGFFVGGMDKSAAHEAYRRVIRKLENQLAGNGAKKDEDGLPEGSMVQKYARQIKKNLIKNGRMLDQHEWQPFVDQQNELTDSPEARQIPHEQRYSHDSMTPAYALADHMEEEGDPRHHLFRSLAQSYGSNMTHRQELVQHLGIPDEYFEPQNLYFNNSHFIGHDGSIYSVQMDGYGTQKPYFTIRNSLAPSEDSYGVPMNGLRHFWHEDAKDFANQIQEHSPEDGQRMHKIIDSLHDRWQREYGRQDQPKQMSRKGGKKNYARSWEEHSPMINDDIHLGVLADFLEEDGHPAASVVRNDKKYAADEWHRGKLWRRSEARSVPVQHGLLQFLPHQNGQVFAVRALLNKPDAMGLPRGKRGFYSLASPEQAYEILSAADGHQWPGKESFNYGDQSKNAIRDFGLNPAAQPDFAPPQEEPESGSDADQYEDDYYKAYPDRKPKKNKRKGNPTKKSQDPRTRLFNSAVDDAGPPTNAIEIGDKSLARNMAAGGKFTITDNLDQFHPDTKALYRAYLRHEEGQSHLAPIFHQKLIDKNTGTNRNANYSRVVKQSDLPSLSHVSGQGADKVHVGIKPFYSPFDGSVMFATSHTDPFAHHSVFLDHGKALALAQRLPHTNEQELQNKNALIEQIKAYGQKKRMSRKGNPKKKNRDDASKDISQDEEFQRMNDEAKRYMNQKTASGGIERSTVPEQPHTMKPMFTNEWHPFWANSGDEDGGHSEKMLTNIFYHSLPENHAIREDLRRVVANPDPKLAKKIYTILNPNKNDQYRTVPGQFVTGKLFHLIKMAEEDGLLGDYDTGAGNQWWLSNLDKRSKEGGEPPEMGMAMSRRGKPVKKSREIQPVIEAVQANPNDQAARFALSDHLEESGLHHDDATLHHLRNLENPVYVIQHPASGKIVASPNRRWLIGEFLQHHFHNGDLRPYPDQGEDVTHDFNNSDRYSPNPTASGDLLSSMFKQIGMHGHANLAKDERTEGLIRPGNHPSYLFTPTESEPWEATRSSVASHGFRIYLHNMTNKSLSHQLAQEHASLDQDPQHDLPQQPTQMSRKKGYSVDGVDSTTIGLSQNQADRVHYLLTKLERAVQNG